jgi:hypothetical protein
MPVFPFQDLPMHLTYAHLLANWDKASLYYTKAAEYNVYFNLHYLLAGLSKIFGNVENAFRFGMAIYFVVFFFCLRFLQQTLEKFKITIEWRPHFILLALNGTMLLGFVAYAWGIPLVILGFALSMRWQLDKYVLASVNFKALMALIFVLGLMHPVLPWAFILATAVYLYPLYPAPKTLSIFSLPLILLWFIGVPGKKNILNIPDNFIHNGYGFEFIDTLFKTNWSGVPTKMNYFFWQWALPVRIIPLLVMLFIMLALFLYVYRQHRQLNWNRPPMFKRANWLLFLGLMLPWGIYWPSEITFINFRMVSTWGMLPFLLMGTFWCQSILGKNLWRWLGILQSTVLLVVLWLAAGDFRAPFSLLEKLPKNASLMPLIYEGNSPSLAKIYRATHFAAMYYVIRNEGRSHQFWGRYTSHLPVDWQDRERMPGPPDWRPWEFEEKHLVRADYVLINFPFDRKREDMSAQQILERNSISVQCQHNWCLYGIKK